MLEVRNISTGYGKKQVVFDVSLTLENGRTALLTGGNGSGKSTVLKNIYGMLPKWNNDCRTIFEGKDITHILTSEMVKHGIVYIPQKNNYFESLTVKENLLVSGSIYSDKEVKERMDYVFKLIPKLYEYHVRTPFNLSGGERQLLALGNALMHKPRLILFDEPFAGLDEANLRTMIDKLLELKQQGISMLIVEHKKLFNKYADSEYKMYLGRIINA